MLNQDNIAIARKWLNGNDIAWVNCFDRRAGLSDEDLRAAVQKVIPLNLGALLMSMFGLMLVIVGVFLA